MTQKIKLIVAIDLLFIFILGISGSMKNSALSNTVYYLAFLIPSFIGYVFITKSLSPVGTIRDHFATIRDFGLNKKGATFALPLIAPEIAIVASVSVITSALMSLMGKTNVQSFDDPFIYAVFIHALLPAMLEELLFRYVPIKLLSENKKCAVILSSLMFAFAHVNVFQIPHAFIAGLIFAFVYISTESIIPTVAMHFFNNLVSLITIYYPNEYWLFVSFAIILIISLVFLFIKRDVYKKAVKAIISSDKPAIGYTPLILVLISLLLAIPALFA